jgi:hypothetical protein
LGRTAYAAFKHDSSSNPRRQFTAPSAKSLVEGRRLKEHSIHVGDPRDVPFRDVFVEHTSIKEQITHGGDLRDVPCRDVLVESVRIKEHSIHVGDFRDVPCRDVLVERKCPFEHRIHAGDIRDVPCRDVRVESSLREEQLIHIGDSGDVPTVDVTVLCSRLILIVVPKINSNPQVIIRESNRGFTEGERVEYNSSKRVRDDVRSLRYVWFGFKVWYMWACWRAVTHTTAALARAVHTFSSGATKRQSEQKHEDQEQAVASTFHSHGCS